MGPLLTPSATTSYQPIADLESKQLLHDLLCAASSSSSSSSPHRPVVNHRHHIARTVASTTYALVFGTRLPTGDEPEIALSRALQDEMGRLIAGPNLVDTFPVLAAWPLRLLPWPWKAVCERHFLAERALHLENLARACERPGWNMAKEMAAAWDKMDDGCGDGADRKEAVAFNIGELADAALDTSAGSLEWFIVAWLTEHTTTTTGGANPSFVDRARAELDAVVGRARLPSFADRPHLPYLDAVLEEVLRWRPIAPTGVAHVASADDAYDGMRVPRGAVVVANQWALTRDRAVYGGTGGRGGCGGVSAGAVVVGGAAGGEEEGWARCWEGWERRRRRRWRGGSNNSSASSGDETQIRRRRAAARPADSGLRIRTAGVSWTAHCAEHDVDQHRAHALGV